MRLFVNIIAILWLIVPFYAVFRGAFQSEPDLIETHKNLFPIKQLSLKNFSTILFNPKGGSGLAMFRPPNLEYIWKSFLNSLIVSNVTTLGVLTIGAFSAYSISRLKHSWTRGFMYISLGTRLVPIMTLMVPLYVILRGYNLLNSLAGVILTEIGFLLPYAIWILTNFFANIPAELEECARIDGCTRLQAFFRIILPLSTPGLASCGVIIFILSWNELIIPLIVTSQPRVMTIPVLLAGMINNKAVFFSLMMAISLVAVTPSVILALILRKYVVQGLTAGALKG